MSGKFTVGDTVRIRNTKWLGRVMTATQTADGGWSYKILAVDLNTPFTREVKQADLSRI